MTDTDLTAMRKPELIAECRRLHATRPGGLTRAGKAELLALAIARRAYAERVKPYKLCERVDRGEIGRIRHEADVSRLDISHWRDERIAELEAAPLDRMLAEYATREQAEQAAAARNRTARRGFGYYVYYLDVTLAELRELDALAA
jgi:phage protein D